MGTAILDKLAKIENMAALAAKTALTMDDATLLTGLSKKTLSAMVSQKKISYYRSLNGKFIYFEREDLNNWMLNIRVDAITEVGRDYMPNIEVFVNREQMRSCLSLIFQGLSFCLKMLYLCS